LEDFKGDVGDVKLCALALAFTLHDAVNVIEIANPFSEREVWPATAVATRTRLQTTKSHHMHETSTSKHLFSLPQCRLKDWELGLLQISDDPEVQFRDVF
jgi:hypothetical protein